MAFADPFPGLSKPLDKQDLVRALRLDLAAEEEAVNLYTAHADATNDPDVREVLLDIANEERTHIGEFEHVIAALTEGDEEFHRLRGRYEVEKKFPNISYKAIAAMGGK